ncbi:MAG: hypothetical protein P8Y45_17685 [Exilibacterium sp.]
MKKIFASLIMALSLSTSAMASSKYELEFVDAFGTGCPDPSVISVEKAADGSFFIKADFDKNAGPDAFSAATDAEVALARTDCTIQYKIKLGSKYKLKQASFSVDGEYSLTDEGGRAFFSIRQNVPGVVDPVFVTARYSAATDPLDDIWYLEGNFRGLFSSDINYCGATIPIEVQVRGSARHARNAQDDTFIAIFNGEGDINARRGYRRIHCKPIFVPCE